MSLGAPYGAKSEALEALRGGWWRMVLERKFLLGKNGQTWITEVQDGVSRLYILEYEMREAEDEHTDELGAEFTQLQVLMHNRYNQLCSNDTILLA